MYSADSLSMIRVKKYPTFCCRALYRIRTQLSERARRGTAVATGCLFNVTRRSCVKLALTSKNCCCMDFDIPVFWVQPSNWATVSSQAPGYQKATLKVDYVSIQTDGLMFQSEKVKNNGSFKINKLQYQSLILMARSCKDWYSWSRVCSLSYKHVDWWKTGHVVAVDSTGVHKGLRSMTPS